MLPLALSVPPNPHTEGLGVGRVRMAPPGAVFLRSRGVVSGQSEGGSRGGGSPEARGKSMAPSPFRWTRIGLASACPGHWARLRGPFRSGGGRSGLVQWPILQHQPCRRAQSDRPSLISAGATGAAFELDARPPAPRLAFRGRDGWAVTVGSGGVRVSRCIGATGRTSGGRSDGCGPAFLGRSADQVKPGTVGSGFAHLDARIMRGWTILLMMMP